MALFPAFFQLLLLWFQSIHVQKENIQQPRFLLPIFFVQGAEDFSYFLFTMLTTVQVCMETDYNVKTPQINKTSLKLIY